MSSTKTTKLTQISPDAPKSWWPGDPRVDPFMTETRRVIQKYHPKGSPEAIDIYNRAYEAVYWAIKATQKRRAKPPI